LKTTRGKSLLLIFSVILVLIALSNNGIRAQGPATVYVDPPSIADLALTPGKTFSININVSGVEDLWGYTVVLSYNTTVLTATAYSSYDPFTQPGPSLINDTAGWAYLYFTMQMGAPLGVSGNVPLVKLDFTVDASGVTLLDLHDTKLVTSKATSISYTELDGSFTNVKVHNIVVANVTASPTRVATPGGLVTLNVIIVNKGDFDETYNVTIRYGSVLIGEETDLFLGSGENTTRTFSWDTTGLELDEYTLEVKAAVALDNYPKDNTFSVKVRVGVIRDVAVTNVTASQTEAAVGESIIVRVTIRNLGNFRERVTIQARYDSTLIGTTTNEVLEEGGSKDVPFNWRTNATAGEYVLSGEAVIEVDDNLANNVFEGDMVRLGGTSSVPIIFLYAGGALVAIIVVAVILRFAFRARKSQSTSV